MKPCRNCRSTDRYKNGKCVPCLKKRQKANAVTIAANHQEWRKKNPDKIKSYHFKAKYCITTEQYDAMFAKQNGLCKLCEQSKKLVVDHCHETNRIRGLLCIGCNAALGAYQKLSKEPYKTKLKTYL